jgi:hypothetical protein
LWKIRKATLFTYQKRKIKEEKGILSAVKEKKRQFSDAELLGT